MKLVLEEQEIRELQSQLSSLPQLNPTLHNLLCRLTRSTEASASTAEGAESLSIETSTY